MSTLEEPYARAGKSAPRRSFSHDERVAALLFLDAGGGCVRGAARKLGIPEATLLRWSRGERSPQARIDAPKHRQQLGDILERAARAYLQVIPEKLGRASLGQVATALGIVLDALIQLDEIRPRPVPEIDALELAGWLSAEEWDRLGYLLRKMRAVTANAPE